jgi:hypothetical protein
MTTDILTDLGEEYVIKNDLQGSITVGMYNDNTDSLSDTSTLSDITTEPDAGTTNYSRVTVDFSAFDNSGDWAVQNDSLVSFDFSDVSTSETLDSVFFVVNFQAEDTSDGSPQDHLIANGFDESVDISTLTTWEFPAGNLIITVE